MLSSPPPGRCLFQHERIGEAGTEHGTPLSGYFLLMALAGGFLLNLMPCVLPLLSVKAMNLISQSGERKPVLIRHGLLIYGGYSHVSFWILTLVIVLLQQSGQSYGLGVPVSESPLSGPADQHYLSVRPLPF